MSDFYMQLKAKNPFDAYLVIKNELNKDISNIALFEEFIDISMDLAMTYILFQERKQYIEEATSALALFSECVQIDAEVLALIKYTRERINNTLKAILEDEQEYFQKKAEEARKENNSILTQISAINTQMTTCEDQKSFDVLLSELAKLEEKLEKELFTDHQKKTYDILTQRVSTTVSETMEKIHHLSLLEYNKQAIRQFKGVFDAYCADKKRYKDSETTLKSLLTSKFFSFDTSKLFNESLIYYNHVYSMIFNESSDYLKFKITEWALTTKKI